MVNKANRKEKLIAAAQNVSFLDVIYNIYRAEPDGSEGLPLEMAALHNDGLENHPQGRDQRRHLGQPAQRHLTPLHPA